MNVNIYTYAHCCSHTRSGGWAARVDFPNDILELSGQELNTSCSRMVVVGIMTALEALPSGCAIKLYTASKHIKRVITKWLPEWIENNWARANGKPIIQSDFWKRFFAVCRHHEIDWQWVNRDAGNLEEHSGKAAFMAVCDRARKIPIPSPCTEPVEVILTEDHFFEGFCGKEDWTIWTPHCELEGNNRKGNQREIRNKIASLFFQEMTVRLFEEEIKTPASIHPDAFKFVSLGDNGRVIHAVLERTVAEQLYAHAKSRVLKGDAPVARELSPFPRLEKLCHWQWEIILAACMDKNPGQLEQEVSQSVYSLLQKET